MVIIKKSLIPILISVFIFNGFFNLKAAVKPRIIVLTDIENEPDDAMSMVRFLTYSNQWNVEALIATTSIHQRKATAAWRIREIVEAYGGSVGVESEIGKGSRFYFSLPVFREK